MSTARADLAAADAHDERPTGLPLRMDDALARRLSGAPALVLLDVDGTLAPLAPRPEEAVVPAATLALVEALVATPETHVALVSGRAALDALRMVPVRGLWAVGNHGFETHAPDGTVMVEPLVEPWLPELSAAAAALSQVAAGVPGSRLEDKHLTLSLHYRLAAPDAEEGLREACWNEAARRGLVFTEGKKIFEVRAPVRVDKGTASVALAERLGALVPEASLFFAGDDVTDEDASRALRGASPQAVTVRVGAIPSDGTAAEFAVPSVDGMRALLAWLAEVRRPR
jgi:trehalose-phosphatase